MRPESGPDLVAEVVCEIAYFSSCAKHFDLRRILVTSGACSVGRNGLLPGQPRIQFMTRTSSAPLRA
jgi:hypothetical protein